MEYTLTLQKADLRELNGYVVFSPGVDADIGRVRPKLTVLPEDWIAMGRPVQIEVTALGVREAVIA